MRRTAGTESRLTSRLAEFRTGYSWLGRRYRLIAGRGQGTICYPFALGLRKHWSWWGYSSKRDIDFWCGIDECKVRNPSIIKEKSFQQWELFYLALFTLNNSKKRFRTSKKIKILKKVVMAVRVYHITIQRLKTLPIVQLIVWFIFWNRLHSTPTIGH